MQEIPYGYCHCGCGQKTTLAPQTHRPMGYVKGEPRRFRTGHSTRLSATEYIVDDVTGCWIWQKGKDGRGYGAAWTGERVIKAHRMMWERHRGPIPAGLDIDHLCRVKACVNPDHLEPVTRAENCRRGARAKLKPEQLVLIRELLAEGELRQSDIAERAGVKKSMVDNISRGRRWAA